MHSGLAGIYPGDPRIVLPVEGVEVFDAGESFRPGRKDVVPILQVHPVLLGFARGRLERGVKPRRVTVAATTPECVSGAHSIAATSPTQHLMWAHFFQLLALKDLHGDAASIGASLLGTPRYVVWACKDQGSGGWIFTCCLDDSCCYEWHPGDQFALYET